MEHEPDRNNTAQVDNGKNNIQEESTGRLITPMKIGKMKRTMDNAEKRMLRHTDELAACRSCIRRKTADRTDEKGKVIGQMQLNPTQIDGYRLKRVQVERDLAIAKGDYLQARRAYRKAVSHNFQVEMDAVKTIRDENRIRREATKLKNKTLAALQKHGDNEGAAEIAELKRLAGSDDVKGFRNAFDQILHRVDPVHYDTISNAPIT
ncbi:MAG: hypothetical protein NTV54_00170 [Ignavibacteriales bacterium]|nr:hypothetical protein [Ignavibacteriales bacterium]